MSDRCYKAFTNRLGEIQGHIFSSLASVNMSHVRTPVFVVQLGLFIAIVNK